MPVGNLNRQPEGYSYVNLAFRKTIGSDDPRFSPTRLAWRDFLDRPPLPSGIVRIKFLVRPRWHQKIDADYPEGGQGR